MSADEKNKWEVQSVPCSRIATGRGQCTSPQTAAGILRELVTSAGRHMLKPEMKKEEPDPRQQPWTPRGYCMKGRRISAWLGFHGHGHGLQTRSTRGSIFHLLGALTH